MKKITIFFIILFSISLQAQWVQQNSGTNVNLMDVFCLTENTVIVIGNGGTILKTIDGGTTWGVKSSGTSVGLTKVQFINATIGFAVGATGTLLKTINSGESWTSLNTGTNANLFGLSCLNENILFITGDNGLIKKTIDGGVTFTNNNSTTNLPVKNIQFMNEQIGYATVLDEYPNNNNKLIKSTDGGLTWLEIPNVHIRAFYFLNENLGYLIDINGSLLKTIDGGLSFTYDNGTGNPNLADIFPINENLVWSIASNFPLCTCQSYCVSKRNFIENINIGFCYSNYLFQPFEAIHFANENSGYIVGWGGSIFKNATGSMAVNDFDKKEAIRIYPNPAKDQITLTFTETPNPFEVSIADGLGKTVFSQTYSAQNNVSIATAAFSKGVYFLTLSNQDKKQTQKLIID